MRSEARQVEEEVVEAATDKTLVEEVAAGTTFTLRVRRGLE